MCSDQFLPTLRKAWLRASPGAKSAPCALPSLEQLSRIFYIKECCRFVRQRFFLDRFASIAHFLCGKSISSRQSSTLSLWARRESRVCPLAGLTAMRILPMYIFRSASPTR